MWEFSCAQHKLMREVKYHIELNSAGRTEAEGMLSELEFGQNTETATHVLFSDDKKSAAQFSITLEIRHLKQHSFPVTQQWNIHSVQCSLLIERKLSPTEFLLLLLSRYKLRVTLNCTKLFVKYYLEQRARGSCYFKGKATAGMSPGGGRQQIHR